MSYEVTVYPDVRKTENPFVVKGQRHIFKTFDELKKAVVKIAWSPGVFKDDHRKKLNFEFAQVIGLDFDEAISMLEVAIRLKKLGLDYAISLTRHHQIPKPQKDDDPKPACDRFRVVRASSAI